MELITSLILVGAGLLLAFAGRRYVWLLISGTGFLLAFWLASLILPGNSLATLLLALAAGIAAGFLFRALSRIVLWIVGFILVGTAAVALGEWFGMVPWSSQWVLTFLAGGVLGLVLATFARGLGIMVITALGGAAMVMIGLPDLGVPDASSLMNLAGPIVAVAGFIVQYSTRGRG
ncbi:MAG TPA: hypothetical protein VJ160_03570 [Anaerolineales bacterium]|nr:hypothetical protein [Anaerolineales bacterium]